MTALNPVGTGATLAAARERLAAGDMAGALDVFRGLIAEGRDLPDAFQGAGYALSELQSPVEAERMIAASLAIEPRNSNGWFLRGQIVERMGQIPDAVQYFRTALQYNPSHERALAALAQLGLAQQQTAPAPQPVVAPPAPAPGAPVAGGGDDAEVLGVYQFLLDDPSPLSQQAVQLIHRLQLERKARMKAFLGHRVGKDAGAADRGPKLVRFLVAVAALTVVGLIVVYLLSSSDAGRSGGVVNLSPQANLVFGTATLALGGVLFLAGAIAFTRWAIVAGTTRYTVVRGRLQVEYGLLSRQVKAVDLWKVRHVDFHQSVWNRMTRDGTIALYLTDGGDRPLLVTGIARLPELEDIRQDLMNLVFALRSNPLVKGIVQ